MANRAQELLDFAAPPIQGGGAASDRADKPALSVAQLTKAIKGVLEAKFTDVLVEGEISNFTHHRSGHRYFTLKDSEAQISAVFWKTREVNFPLKDGLRVICRGQISLYAPRGSYQLDVFQIRPVGVGELQKAYEALFAKLEAEGLFLPSRKRPIPRYPRRIGIVTSETGAALHDILTVLRRRYPLASVVLRPSSVQGVGAELEIARAIQEFGLLSVARRPDVLIVGRGGGSLEDLWSFNEEAVARAIYASPIPIVSAVGHEVDVTIADFVADLRAPTPTAAAELCTPDRDELLSVISGIEYAGTQIMKSALARLRREIEIYSSDRGLRGEVRLRIRREREAIESIRTRILRSAQHSTETLRLTLERDRAQLRAMNPFAVLDRGYSIVETQAGTVISSPSGLLEQATSALRFVFSSGTIDAYVAPVAESERVRPDTLGSDETSH